ncbi:hypothetical protein [Variovorax sp. RCC_210]|uniref:hypothetical protein n=1 Tax=Variovorax sp. RCC_210 TaxID=3239217 RepID=UPI0035248417
MKKKTVPRANRAVECYELLQLLSRRQMPVVCSAPEDIHLILALRSASLLVALTDPSVVSQTGERRIPRAIVTGLTAQGRAACMGDGTSPVGGGRPAG